MADPQFPGFAKLVPGFDFLQSLAKGASQSLPQVPGLSNWVAPTLSVEELDKRLADLKAVQFWLDQNAKALAATIQALEVQKMTLATLKGMNLQLGELASAMQLKPGPKDGEDAKAAPAKAAAKGKAASAGSVVDPLQWWGALTQQFQQIAADAFQDAARTTAVDTARHMATGVAKEAMKTASGMVRAAAPGRKAAAKPARKTPAKRAAKGR